MALGIDPALERTPPDVAAMKIFKEKLLQGQKVKAAQFGLELPKIDMQPDVAYRSSDDSDGAEVDELVDEMDKMDEDYTAEDEQFESAYASVEADRSPTNLNAVQYPAHKGRAKDPLELLSDWLNNNQAKEELKIIGPFGKIGFKALNVSITDLGVAFIIKKDAIQFEPNVNTELTIQYRGQDYPVIYAGGFFTFAKIPFTFVSFLRVQN